MNKLNPEAQARIISCLVEGCSLRSTVRLTGTHRTTVQNLLVAIGAACSAYQDKAFVNLTCKRIQCDEIWAFVGAKEKNATPEQKEIGWGDAWTWVAICPDTKLVPTWLVGPRDASTAYHFMHDLAPRLKSRVQLTTDGHKAYLQATEDAFGAGIDFAQLVKLYGNQVGPGISAEVRYSPAQCMGARKTIVCGQPEHKHSSTSHVERQNLTMRMSMRRFTRLTNGFSKKLENHEAALALYFMNYNFARIHQTLRVTPAMESGVSDHVWSLKEIVSLLQNQ